MKKKVSMPRGRKKKNSEKSNTIDCHFSLEFSKICVMIEIKIITPSNT